MTEAIITQEENEIINRVDFSYLLGLKINFQKNSFRYSCAVYS